MAAMGAVLTAWVVLFWVQAGVGLLLVPRLRNRSVGDGALDAFWIGLAGVIAFLQLLHMWRPVDALSVGIVIAAGLAGLALFAWQKRGDLRRPKIAAPRWRSAWPLVAIGALAVTWFLNLSIENAQQYDSGLYHEQTMLWLQHFRIVPGLGNLHDRLAFNSSTLLYDALINRAWHIAAGHVANSLLLTVCTVDLLRRSRPLLQGTWSATAITAALLLPGVLMLGYEQRELSSPSLDLPAFVVVAAALVRLVAWHEHSGKTAQRVEIAAALSLLAVAPTLRLQLAPFAISGLIALLLWWPGTFRARLSLLLIPALLVVPWMIRGAVLSGYPLYPSTVFALPFSWRIPTATASATAAAVRGYSRAPGPGYIQAEHGWQWFGMWWHRALHSDDLRGPIALGVVAVAVLMSAVLQAKRSDHWRLRKPQVVTVTLCGCLLNLVIWFLAAPDPRFVLGLLWGTAALAVALAVAKASTPGSRWPSVAVPCLAVLVSAHALAHVVRHFNVVHGAPNTYAHLHVDPTVATMVVSIPGGTIRVPISGDQCWATPIPCAPSISSGLRYRAPGRPQIGFAVRR